MNRLSPILGKAQKAFQDFNFLQILQSEIAHELSSNPFQGVESGALGDFAVDWDSSDSRDVVLRSKCETGEEVVVSALLGPLNLEREIITVLPRDVLMKVCVKKPGLKSILQFDCDVYQKGQDRSEFEINNAYYLQSPTALKKSTYRGPLFSNLDLELQDAMKDYLISRGIGEHFTNFLLLHLHKKEQSQYLDWLKKLDSSASKSE